MFGVEEGHHRAELLTDILVGVTGMHSKSSPKYGSEKSGAPTNYYITLSPDEKTLYVTESGNVYFEVTRADDYGKLSNRRIEYVWMGGSEWVTPPMASSAAMM